MGLFLGVWASLRPDHAYLDVVRIRAVSSDENEQFALASERAALENFLDAQREGLIRQIQGLNYATARQAPTASSLSP